MVIDKVTVFGDDLINRFLEFILVVDLHHSTIIIIIIGGWVLDFISSHIQIIKLHLNIIQTFK